MNNRLYFHLILLVSLLDLIQAFTIRHSNHHELHQGIRQHHEKQERIPNSHPNDKSSSITLTTSTRRRTSLQDVPFYFGSVVNDTETVTIRNTPSETKPSWTSFAQTAVPGPPAETKPDYDNIVGPLGRFMDTVFLVVFRRKLAEQTGSDSARPWTDYEGITELAARMNRQIRNRTAVQQRAQETLRSLFPSWLPKQYAILFSKPFPAFSARMNAWATYVAGTWLMGECQVNDIVLEEQTNSDGTTTVVMGKDQGLLVKRCRFLEQSQCASVCVNSCKIPTQNFFLQDMGLPLTMEPNYETFECQFSFGKHPTLETERVAASTPCLLQCPAAGGLRQSHDTFVANPTRSVTTTTVANNDGREDGKAASPCAMMPDTLA